MGVRLREVVEESHSVAHVLRHLGFILEAFFPDPGDLTLGRHTPDEELQECGLNLVQCEDLDGILP